MRYNVCNNFVIETNEEEIKDILFGNVTRTVYEQVLADADYVDYLDGDIICEDFCGVKNHADYMILKTTDGYLMLVDTDDYYFEKMYIIELTEEEVKEHEMANKMITMCEEDFDIMLRTYNWCVFQNHKNGCMIDRMETFMVRYGDEPFIEVHSLMACDFDWDAEFYAVHPKMFTSHDRLTVREHCMEFIKDNLYEDIQSKESIRIYVNNSLKGERK